MLLNAGVFTVLWFFRYKNQDLPLHSFELFKTGNLLTFILFSSVLLLQVWLSFSLPKVSTSFLGFSLFLILLSAVLLLMSNYFFQKDLKIILAGSFLMTQIILLTSTLSVCLSSEKNFYVFRTVFLLSVITFTGLLVVFLKVYTFKDDSEIYAEGNRKADAGAILGAAVWGGNKPSPVLRERINKGYEIYNKKYVPRLILTGGGSKNEMTEADVAKNELLKYGIDPKNLDVENTSNSTLEQILWIRDFLYKSRNWKKIIIVSDNFHLFRSKQICRFNNMDADAISSDTPLSTEGGVSFCIKETFAVVLFWFAGIG
ncbi:hypothetical protein BH10BAC5_BH10BAC5_22560 [soil metagenome]